MENSDLQNEELSGSLNAKPTMQTDALTFIVTDFANKVCNSTIFQQNISRMLEQRIQSMTREVTDELVNNIVNAIDTDDIVHRSSAVGTITDMLIDHVEDAAQNISL
jgi:hypothetical protein